MLSLDYVLFHFWVLIHLLVTIVNVVVGSFHKLPLYAILSHICLGLVQTFVLCDWPYYILKNGLAMTFPHRQVTTSCVTIHPDHDGLYLEGRVLVIQQNQNHISPASWSYALRSRSLLYDSVCNLKLGQDLFVDFYVSETIRDRILYRLFLLGNEPKIGSSFSDSRHIRFRAFLAFACWVGILLLWHCEINWSIWVSASMLGACGLVMLQFLLALLLSNVPDGEIKLSVV